MTTHHHSNRRGNHHLPPSATTASDAQPAPPLGRRTFIAGLGAAVVLAACGDDGSGDTASGDTGQDDTGQGDTGQSGGASDLDVAEEFRGDSADLEAGTFTLAQRFPSTALVPGEVRLPHSLFRDAEFVNDGPATLGAQVVDIDLNPIGERMIAPRLDVSPSAYYVWRPTIETPGVYFLVVDGGPSDGAAFQVMEPDQVAVPSAGEALPGFATPTTASPEGVEPICTRDPVCPFHAVTLDDALADGRSVAYLVGTPAFCQTGTCAPALEALVEVAPDFEDDVVFVHAEVFTDLTAQEIAPAVEAVSMTFEPALFITDPAGVVVERIDAIWGVDELRERLELVRA